MKKRVFVLVLSFCILFAFAVLAAPSQTALKASAQNAGDNMVLKTRFLNMLNRNFVYNADFDNADVITENSIIALLNRRDAENSDYISESVVKGFVYDMYGVKITEINEDESVHKDGFIYIIPRGFTSFNHTITEIKTNEDGSFTVISSVTVSPHDDDEFITTANTLFVPNEKSAFGYNIISSNIKGIASGI